MVCIHAYRDVLDDNNNQGYRISLAYGHGIGEDAPGVQATQPYRKGLTGRQDPEMNRMPPIVPSPLLPHNPLKLPGSPRVLEAALWMSGSALIFAVGNTMLRYATAEMHPFEVVFFRNLFSLVFLLPWMMRRKMPRLSAGRAGLYVTRSVTTLVAMMAWFYSIAHIALPTATAISFATPLFTAIGAALFLGETVHVRRWAGVLAGFAGVLIVLRPGVIPVDTGTAILLVHCIAAATSVLQMRTLAKLDGSWVVVTYLTLFITPLALLPALTVWVWPSWTMLGYLVLLAGVLTIAQLAMTHAFSLAEASAVMPFDYARLPLTALIAWVAFGELMDLWSWVGAAVIAGSALYTAHAEATRRGAPAAGAVASSP